MKVTGYRELGAEVTDFDVMAANAVEQDIRDLLNRHEVLCFRNQKYTHPTARSCIDIRPASDPPSLWHSR